MPGSFLVRALLIAWIVVPLAGCRLVVDRDAHGRSPLLPLVSTPDATTLEVFSSPVPLADPRLAELWKQVDEQPLPPETRSRLSQHGLRAGIVGPAVPDLLADLLKVTDKQISSAERMQMPMETEEGISLVVMQPRAGERRDLVTSPTYEQMALLECNQGKVGGRSYSKAQGRMVLRVFPEPDSRVRVELTPELHHGEFRSKITGNDAMYVMKQERQKQVFEELKIATTLAPGQMLLVTCQDQRPGSIGHYFLTNEQDDKKTQKLYVIRLSQAGIDRSFNETVASGDTTAAVTEPVDVE